MRPFVAVLLTIGALIQIPMCTVAAAEQEPTVVDGPIVRGWRFPPHRGMRGFAGQDR